MVNLADRIREERKRLGLKQNQLGVAPNTQRFYESGSRSPDANYLSNFATLGADVLYIVTGQRSAGVLSPDEMELLETYRHIPIDKRSVFRTVGVTLADTRQVKR